MGLEPTDFGALARAPQERELGPIGIFRSSISREVSAIAAARPPAAKARGSGR